MKRLFLYIGVYVITTASTCGPLSIDTVVVPDINTQTNSILVDSVLQVEFKVVHSHAVSKHTGLIFRTLFINRNIEPITIKTQCIHINSRDIKYNLTTTNIAYYNQAILDFKQINKDTTLIVSPGDTLLYQNMYSSSFRGNYDDFKDTLRSSKIYFTINNIYINNKEIKKENLELVPILNKK